MSSGLQNIDVGLGYNVATPSPAWDARVDSVVCY
jgi:hypothetical protein